jgi:hypothetical protein
MNEPNHVQIKLLGIGSTQDQAFKANLMVAIESLSSEVEVIEVSNLDDLLNYGISGIPALLLDEVILFQKTVPSVEELRSTLQQELEYKMMISRQVSKV